MARRKESFPPAFADALRAVAREGELVLTFDTEEICTRERLRFYRFLAAVRADVTDELQPIAASALVQWRSLYGEKARRVLRIVGGAKSSDDVWAQAARGVTNADSARELEIEDALARARIEAMQLIEKN